MLLLISQELLERIPQGYNLVTVLRDQQNQLLSGCGPAVCSSVKVELDSASKRIDNLDAALRTWNEFLTRIKSVSDLYEKMSSEIEKLMYTVQAGINQESCEIGRSGEGEFIAVPYLEKMINTLKVNCYAFSFFYFIVWFFDTIFLSYFIIMIRC